ncbi:hypothetical protein SanaruYs_02970 [Chryseotalea sanaruensis]|uniref:Uncharacterized protein n=1 Tax=Chryseotalea sanaruensis TaxID=2482724 RepID=A0A401U5C7_9BACT|nr:hypothetical protein [Chryseotalea sanaruensis]GCC50082.1 hypothetical protein SanaruYs_02970 [Chryseotalea sanaruensis]
MKFKPFILLFTLSPLFSIAQGLAVSSDTAAITFPNKVEISINKQNKTGKTYYQLSQQSFKALILTTNYYVQREALLTTTQLTLLKNQQVADSTYTLLHQKFETEQERSKLFQQSYEELKTVSVTYDEQLRLCANDLEKMNGKLKRSQRIGIVKGVSISLGFVGLVWLASSAF